MMEKLEAGKVTNLHGLKGLVKVQTWTDYPEVFEQFSSVFIGGREFEITQISYQKNNILLGLAGITTPEAAAKLKEQVVFCRKEELGTLPEGTYFVADLISCAVFENGEEIGMLRDVISTGAADLYEIQKKDKTVFYLPAIKENVLDVNIQDKKITIQIPEGLI